MDKMAPKRAEFFSKGEQMLLVELFEEYKDIITVKGNTAAINKSREAAWQRIADRLNGNGLGNEERSWMQVKIKYKNILQSAIKKKAQSNKIGWRNRPEGLTPAEELALTFYQARPVVEKVEGETSTNSVPQGSRQPFIEYIVSQDAIILVDPPQGQSPQEDLSEVHSAKEQQTSSILKTLEEAKEETVPPVPNMPEKLSEMTSTAEQNEDVKSVYKRHLLLDIEYKQLKMRRIQLEIKKLERELGEI